MKLSDPGKSLAYQVAEAYLEKTSEPELKPLGNGNINKTFLVDDGTQRFVLQQINSSVFPEPYDVCLNFSKISNHIITSAETAGISYRCATPLFSREKELAIQDSEHNWWRAQSYIEHIPPANINISLATLFELGQILSRFHDLTAGLDVASLAEPLPGFHNTPDYLAMYDRSVETWSGEMSAELDKCFRFVEQYRGLSHVLLDEHKSGNIGLRAIHGDPKLDNVIFSSNKKPAGFFDLDTVGPGFLLYDLGDCLRSCNNNRELLSFLPETGGEILVCREILKGYFADDKRRLSRIESALLFDAVLLLTFELGLRFLTDHLRGDVYFNVLQKGENLQRARSQFQLADRLKLQEKQFHQMVQALCQ